MTRGAIPVLGILLIGSAFLANAEPAGLSPSASESPLELLTAAQKDYLYVKTFEERRTAAEDANDTYDRLFCYGSPVELKWTGTTGTCTVEVKRTSDGKVVWTGTTDGLSVTVHNLEIGAGYEWTVTCGGASASAAFTTSDRPPRLIKTGLVRMLRDLGGWTGTLGGRQYRIRQNLIFRGAAVDDPKATGTQPPYLIEDDSDRDFLYNIVRLKNEVDLRNLNNTSDVTAAARQSGQYMLDPTGEHVTYNNCPFTASSALSASDGFFAALKLLLDPDKLPAYFHCKSGRDRTGMVSAFLLALLGVSRDDIVLDYQTTSDQNNWSKYGFSTFLDTSLGQYQKDTASLAENARAFLLKNGITSAQVEAFRETMLEGYTAGDAVPVNFCVTPYLQRPASDAMTIIFFTDLACKATVTCQLHDVDATPRRVLTETTVGVWAQALTNNVFCKESSEWGNSLHRHRVRFEGLEPNRIYDYTVTLAGGATYSNRFRTAPNRDTPIRFVSYADSEAEKNPWDNFVANLKCMGDRQPDFFALSGDYAARGGRQEHWDGFWKANAGAKTDVAGSIPILAVIGNHDLFDQGSHSGGYWYDMQGEPSTERYLTYFESTSNGVDFANAPAPHTETRDMSQLFHREDYGPVTLIFLDTNNGQDGDTDADHDRDSNYLTSSSRLATDHLVGGLDRRAGCRHPDFNIGTPQYVWLTNNLADAQAKSRFTFVLNHHCPYSRGAHNQSWKDGEDGSALALRALTETMVRYGVDGWYCGHDELLEHSITNGWEILPDGSRRRHTLSIYDLGCSGDTPRTSNVCTNPLEYWWSSGNYGGNGSYGFLETDVTTNRNGRWTCTITPVQGSTGSYVPGAQIVYVENPDRGENENDLVYAETANTGNPIDGASQTKPSDWVAWEKPPEGPTWDETVDVELTEVSAADLTYNGAEQSPRLTVKAGDLTVPRDHYTVSTSPSPVRDAREYSVTVTGTGNVRGSKKVPFKVNRAPATVKADDKRIAPGDPEPELTATVSGIFNGETLDYTLSREPGDGIDDYDIIVTGAAVQGNYDVTFVNGTFRIAEPTVEYTGTVEEKDVGGDTVYVFKSNGTLTLPKDVLADILVVGGGGAGAAAKSSTSYYRGNGGNGGSVTSSPLTPMKAGTYAVTVGLGGEGKTYVDSTEKFTAGGNGGESSIAGTGFATVKASGGAGNGTGNKGSDGTSGSSAQNGSSDITGDTVAYGRGGPGASGTSRADGANGQVFGEGGGGSANGGRSGSGASGVVIVRIVNPVELTEPLTAEATYDGTVQAPTFEGITVELGDWDGTPRNVGEYHCTARGTGRFTGEVGVTFTIHPAQVTVTADDKRIAPGDPDPELTVTITGLQGDDPKSCIVYSISREPGDDLRDYDITVTGKAEQGNYTVSFVKGTFTIKEKVIFEPGQDAEIMVSGPTTVDVGEKAISVGKVTIKGEGNLTIGNYQNLTPSSVDLNGFSGTVTYEYVSPSANKSLPSGLADEIKKQTSQKVKYAFLGASAANGWNLGSWSAKNPMLSTHLVFGAGTHTWDVDNTAASSTSQKFGANGTDDNPTVLVRDGAKLTMNVHDLSGYLGAYDPDGVIRVNAGGVLNFIARTSGQYHNFNYRQRLVLDPGSETTFDYSSSYLFVIHGGSDIGGDVVQAQIYVPESDGTAGPAILRRKSSSGVGLCINGSSASRGGGCAIYVGAGSKLLLDSNVKIGESDSGTGDRALAKYGAGELEITGEVTKDVAFKAYEGVLTLPVSSGAFNGGLTAAKDVTYRFPAQWADDTAYTLGSGTVNGTAPEADEATVYVGEKKLTGVTLVYSGKTVRYVKPPEPQPIASVAVVADLTYNGAVQTPSVVVTAQDGTTVPPDAYRVSTDPEPVRTARDYTLTVTGTTPLYFGEATTPFAVSRAQATVKADGKSKEFGAEDPEFTATVTGTYGDDKLDYELAREDDDENYGAHGIRAFGDDVQGNYDVTYEKGTLSITKAMPKPEGTLTAEITYGTKLSGATVVGKMKHGDTEVVGTFTFVELNHGPSVTDSGTEYAAVFTPSNTINYASAEVKVKVTVAKRVLTVHAANVSVAYGTDTPAYGYVLSGFVSGESVANVTIRGNPTYASGYSSTLAVGECEVSVLTIGTLEADNYSFTVDSTAAKLTVTQRTVTVTSLDAEMTYGTEEPAFAAKIDNVVAGEENRIVYGFTREPGDDVRTGGYLITPTGAMEQGNYIVRFVAAGRLTINPAKITSAIAPSQEYANRTLTPVVTVYAGEQVVPSDGYSIGTWKWSRSEQTAGSGSTVFKTVGINTATVTGKGNFEGTVQVTFEVTKANYDMSGVIFADQTVVYDGKSHSLAYAGTLPKGVRSESTVSNPVYSGNGKTDVGEYTVTVSFTSGDASHYNPVQPMTAKLTIVPAPITSATADSQTYAGKPLTPVVTVKAGSLDVGKSFTVDEWEGNLTDAGTYLGKVSGTGNFTGTVDVVEFTIDPAQLTAATAEEQVYDGTEKTPVLTVKAGSLSVDTYDLGAWSGGLVGAGTYTAEVSGTGNFTGSQTVTFTIAKATYDLSGVGFAGKTVTYDGEAHSLAIEGELPRGVSVRYDGNAQTDAGTYTVTAMFDGDGDNYEPIAAKKATLTIRKASLTAATAAAATYTGKSQTPKLTVMADKLTLQPGDYTISGWNATPKDAGTYKATVTGSGNFTGSAGVEFTISPAPLTVTADDQGVGAGEDPPPFTVSYSGFVNGEDASKLSGTLGFTCAYNPAEATVGQTFEIVPDGLTADNYTITFESGTLTVGRSTPRLKSLTADEITYGETLASSTLKGEAQDAMENPVTGTFAWTDDSIAPTVAESGAPYDVTFTPDDTESYTVAHFHATVKVNPAELTVAVSNATTVYGVAAPKFGCEITGFIEGEDESVVSGARKLTCQYKPFDNAGSYAITPDLATFEADNYTFKSVPGTLTVDKATLTVSAKDLTVTYWDAPPKYAATCSGFLDHDTASVVSGTADLWCAYQQGDKIGPYDIVVSGVSGLSATNYDFIASETPGKLTVGRKSVTVTADNKEKSYGAVDPALTATVTGTVGADTVVYDLAVNYKGASPQEASVGSYTITAKGEANQFNYSVTYKSGTMKVTQASLVGKNLAATIEYGQRLGDAKVTGEVQSASHMWGPSTSVKGTFAFADPTLVPAVEDSGPYTVKFTPENTWAYKPADLTVFVTVTPKTLTVKAVDEKIVYGDVPPVEHAHTITGFIDGEDESVVSGICGYACKYTQFGAVGKYSIEVNCDGLSAKNYVFVAAETPGLLTVGPKTLTVKAVDEKIVYGDAPPADHICEITGFVDGEDESVVSGDCGYICEYVQFDDVGKYPIAVDPGDLSASNYVFAAAETPGQLTVSPAKITSATAAPQTFTGERLHPVVTVKAGDLTLQSGDYTVSDWSGNLTDAGAYTATVTGTGNFTGTAEVTFEVTEADYDMSGVTFEDDAVTYDGKAHALAIGGELPAGVTVEYDVGGKTDAGEYTVTATFRGDSNHKAIADRTATLTINKAKLTSATAEAAFYDGTVKTPVLTVRSGTLEVTTYVLGSWDTELRESGSYMATVTGTGNFEGDVTVLFTIRRATITEATAASQTFTGDRLNPVLTVKAGDLMLQSGDYTVSNWSGGLRDAGTYTATVTGTGNFTGTAAVTFEVTEADYDMSGVTFEDGAVTYDGKAHALAIGGELPAGVTVEYDVGGATEAGEYKVTATFRGDSNHKAIAERTATLTINPAELTSATVPPQTYDGSKKTPVLTVMAGELECTAYDLGEWSGNLTDAGTYTATVTGTGNFAGETKVSFTIAANANANLAIELVGGEVVYDGLVHAPTAIVVRDGGRTLVEGVDYEVLRPDGEIRAAGLYVFTLSGRGNYAGWTGSATFRIRGEVIVTIPSRDGLASHVYADGIELQPVGGSGDGVVYAVPATAKVVVEFAADGASGVRIAGGVQRYEINGIDREISFAEAGDYRIPVTVDMSVPTVAKPTVNVVIASGSEVFAKKVSGGGSKTAVGKNVTLKATAAKNCVFAGWYLDDGCTCPAADDWLNPSYKYTVIPVPETTLYARFLSMADPEATVLEMEAVSYEYEEEPGLLIVPAGEEIAPIRIYVDTLVRPKVTAKNLPSGLKLVQDKVTGEYVIKGKAKKPGELAKPVTLTVKNAVYKKGVVQTLRIIVDNFHDPVAFPDVRDEYDLACGVPAELTIASLMEDAVATVSGLPKGLKFDKQTGMITGTPTKRGTFLVTFKKTLKGPVAKGKHTATARFIVE